MDHKIRFIVGLTLSFISLMTFLVFPKISFAQEFDSTCPTRVKLPFNDRCGFFIQKNSQDQLMISHRYLKSDTFLNDQYIKISGGPFDPYQGEQFDRDLWNKLRMNKNISTRSINLYQLKRNGIEGQYFAAVTSGQRIGSERLVAILVKATQEQVRLGYKVGQYLTMSHGVDWRQYLLIGGDKNNRSLKDYFGYVIEQMPSGGWAVQELQSSIPEGGCKDHNAAYYTDIIKYFYSPFDGNYRLPYTLSMNINKSTGSGNQATPGSATLTLPKPGPSERDYDKVKNRPPITFTYNFYMPWERFTVNNYYYFLPPSNTSYCNLAIRFSDSLGRATNDPVDAYIVAIELNKVSQASSPSVFDDDRNNRLAIIPISRKSLNDFIGALSDGKTPDDQTGYDSDDKKTKQGTDELGGTRAGSGDNPGATSTGTNTKCQDAFANDFWSRFLIGNAICGTLNLFAALAIGFANWTLNILIYSAGLQ